MTRAHDTPAGAPRPRRAVRARGGRRAIELATSIANGAIPFPLGLEPEAEALLRADVRACRRSRLYRLIVDAIAQDIIDRHNS